MTKLADELMPPDTFEATMAYFPVRQKTKSRDIAYAFWVLGQPASNISEQYACSKQNVVKVLARFGQAFERYTAAQRNLQGNPSAAPAAPAPAKKTAAKKAAG